MHRNHAGHQIRITLGMRNYNILEAYSCLCTLFSLFYAETIQGYVFTRSGTARDKTTGLENPTYNILMALGKEAQFLYSTIDTYIEDARKDNLSELENMWKTIKQERQRHLSMLRDALDKQAKQQKLQQ